MRPYPFLQSNLDALEKKNPLVHRWLQDQLASLGPSDRLMRNSKGLLDWMLPEGRSLLRSLPPLSVYKQWRIPEKAETGTTVIVGCNLGYGLNYLLPKTPCGHQVLVLEPRADLLLACLGHTDFTPFLEIGRLLFLPPDYDLVRNILSGLVLPCLFGKILLRADLPSLQLGPEYAIWTDRCREILEDLKINANTFRSQQDQMIVNEMQNLGRASRASSPAALKGKAKGITGVILGAGPSLERFAPALREYNEKALFCTSLQALPSLHRLELKPHFAMVIDPAPALLKVYEELDAKWAADIPLIYSTSVCPEVVKNYPGPTIPIWTITGLASHFRSGKEPVLDAGGNAGVALVRFLRWCGTDRILLVGQDFSWTSTKTHARGHLASGQEFQFDPRRHVRMKNRWGQTVFTAQPYLTPLRELERDLEATPGAVFDLYGGGLPIRGSESVGLNDLSDRVFIGDEPAGVSGFLRIMNQELSPAKPFWHGRSPGWRASFLSANRFLKALLENPSPERQQVVTFFDEALLHLQADPLRKPYLMSEVIDLAGVTYKSRSFGYKELKQCKEIFDRVEKKIVEMDRYLREAGYQQLSSHADVGPGEMAAA